MNDSGWEGHEGGAGFRRVLLALFAAGFATFAQVFDAQAVLPLMSAELAVPPAAASLSLSFATLGMAASVLPWASVADRFGRVRTMKVALIVSGVLGVVTPLAPGFEAFLALRALTGAALGAVPAVAMAYLAEEIHGRRVAQAAAIYVTGNTIGGLVGRLVAGQAGQMWGWRAGLEVVAAFAVAAGIAFVLLAPPPRGYRPVRVPARRAARIVAFHLRDPLLAALYLIGFVHMGAFAALYNYVGYRLLDPPFDVDPTIVNLLFTAYLLGSGSAQLAPRIAARWGATRAMLLGFGLEAVAFWFLLSDRTWAVATGIALFTVGWGFVHPLASGQSGARAQLGRAQSSALYQLAWLTGTAVFGWLIGLVMDAAGWGGAVAGFLMLTVLGAAAAWIGLETLRGRRPSPPAA